jgi:hypothetical protein
MKRYSEDIKSPAPEEKEKLKEKNNGRKKGAVGLVREGKGRLTLHSPRLLA